MSDPQGASDPGSIGSAGARNSAPYGSDWVGIDARALKARREAQRKREREAIEHEQARLRLDEEEILSFADDGAPTAAPTPPRREQNERPPQTNSRTAALVERLHIENLRSFAGPHDVPLAPITLIYGPNSAGKSTIIKGLKLLMQVVNSGRSDALRPWNEGFRESNARNLMTYSEPDPDDPSGFQWRSPLVLGVDFKTHDDTLAYAEVSYDLNPVGSIDVHSTAIGLPGEGQLSRKRFTPEDFADDRDPFHPADFGEALLTRFVVEESRDGEEWSSETRLIDAELFAHED
ncbi:MAG: AAA family ATPase, partial [Cryobacterium sp.]|nr:AAA family ATPase [Cryobacterium sp.]